MYGIQLGRQHSGIIPVLIKVNLGNNSKIIFVILHKNITFN